MVDAPVFGTGRKASCFFTRMGINYAEQGQGVPLSFQRKTRYWLSLPQGCTR